MQKLLSSSLLQYVQGRVLAYFLQHTQVSHQAMTVHSLLRSKISSINHVAECLLHGLAVLETVTCNLKVLLHHHHQRPQSKCDQHEDRSGKPCNSVVTAHWH